MTDLDLSEVEETVGPTDEQLKQVTSLAKQQVASELRIEQLTAELRAAKEDWEKIARELLPDAMAACHLKSFTLESGQVITIKDDVHASIPIAALAQAAQWLRAHNHGAIVKNEFKVPFGAGEDEQARTLEKFLDANGVEFNSRVFVHPQTLKRWVKDQLAEGNEVPKSITYFEFRESSVK